MYVWYTFMYKLYVLTMNMFYNVVYIHACGYMCMYVVA